MPTYMILNELEAATRVAIWVVLSISSYAAFRLTTVWFSEEPAHAAAMNNLQQTKRKWLDDKKRLLAESKAIFDREAYLTEQIQHAENRMAKNGADDASLDLIGVLEHGLDVHWYKIRQNWRELSDLLDRYID
ncbi:hypothetical protein N7527_007156 [Penicillium freii]|uniref:Uncharacterized protein n=1 Tax=Penicillium freii TaxID=48697 RepID=A0A101MI55_PENFR|nr:hypothetical protein N7527_007156 [Penicillium freii]KUM61029.1 hypothetical protein ACN42_g6079 [Penicillium freii]